VASPFLWGEQTVPAAFVWPNATKRKYRRVPAGGARNTPPVPPTVL